MERSAEEPDGLEPALIRELATELGARIEWKRAGVEDQLKALERFELDVVAAGLEKKSPWNGRVALTRPYFENRLILAGRSTTTAPYSLDGLAVAVESSTLLSALVLRSGARTVPLTPDAGSAEEWIAVPEWSVERMGYLPTNHVFKSEERVLALPPGENQWIVHVEKFLALRRARIREMAEARGCP